MNEDFLKVDVLLHFGDDATSHRIFAGASANGIWNVSENCNRRDSTQRPADPSQTARLHVLLRHHAFKCGGD